MVEVGTRVVCVEIFEHCVCGFPGEALGSNKVCGNGSTMGAHIPSHGPLPVRWRVGSRHEQVLAAEGEGGGGGRGRNEIQTVKETRK